MGYTVRIPTLGDRPQFLPAGYHTWFLEHFCVGLIRPVLPFYTTVCSRYRVSPTQLQPNYIRFMTDFYLVCMCAGVDVRRFQTCFLIRNPNPFHFYLSSRSKDKKNKHSFLQALKKLPFRKAIMFLLKNQKIDLSNIFLRLDPCLLK